MLTLIILTILGLGPVHGSGYRGEGVTMAIIDAGFFRANDSTVFDQNRILGVYDLLPDSIRKAGIFDDPRDYHGTCCLSTILYEQDGFTGTAPDVDVYLIRTEDIYREDTAEVGRLIQGLYLADSLDVDVISISLGYWDMDDASTGYTYADMNGMGRVAVAATDVAQRRIVCVSAGNDGAKTTPADRNHISTPADAWDVLTVGAVDEAGKAASFSSFGPTYDGRLKPELAAWGKATPVYISEQDSTGRWTGSMKPGNGTSFSTPEVAGMMACLKQARPSLSSEELRNLAIASCEYPSPLDYQRGHGRPNAAVALGIPTEAGNTNRWEGAGKKNDEVKIENEQVVIERNGEKFTILGRKIQKNLRN